MRILWLVLGALLLVSALPIGLYHRQVLELSQEKLVDTERVQQSELTRSMADEINLFESNLTQQLISQRQILTLTGLIQDVEDPPAQPKVSRLLENFLASNPNTFLYLTAVGRTGKGSAAAQGNFRPEQDPFVSRAMQRAFFACEQALKFRSDPLALLERCAALTRLGAAERGPACDDAAARVPPAAAPLLVKVRSLQAAP